MSECLTSLFSQEIVRGSNVSVLRELALEYIESEAEGASIKWHPLGFIDIPLSVDQTNRVTLHVWHPRMSRPQRPAHLCHSHGWLLTSAVLYGGLRDVAFSVLPDEAGNYELYEVTYRGANSMSTATGTLVSAAESSAREIGAGNYYSIEAMDYHTTKVLAEDLLVTAMYGDARRGGRALNVRPTGRPEYTYTRHECTGTERRALLRDLKRVFCG